VNQSHVIMLTENAGFDVIVQAQINANTVDRKTILRTLIPYHQHCADHSSIAGSALACRKLARVIA